MSPTTRYKPERTLARGIRRLPGDDRATFLAKRQRLREHFVRFNRDVADLCQWIMGLRPNRSPGFEGPRAFWECFLDPTVSGSDSDPVVADRLRRALFETYAGWDTSREADLRAAHPAVMASLDKARATKPTAASRAMLDRLRATSKPHLQVLLKAAAEWVVARYQRGMEAWHDQNRHFQEEKSAWERGHRELTPQAIDRFNRVFRELKVEKKRPRICGWRRLRSKEDNCEFAGERVGSLRHGPRCKLYKDFLREEDLRDRRESAARGAAKKDARGTSRQRGGPANPSKPDNWQKEFEERTAEYRKLRAKHPPDRAMHLLCEQRTRDFLQRRHATQAPADVIARLRAESDAINDRFRQRWARYLSAVGLDEESLARQHGLRQPHCPTFSDDSPCAFNPHTDKCVEYRRRLEALHDDDLLALDPLYREWRRDYLTGPRKPTFRYPSARSLPMPKIFGRDFFRIEWTRSVVGLRLDDMPEGEFVDFAFKPWPRAYSPQPPDADISSVHVTFHGARARVAFRFAVAPRPSRFGVSQDELDELRSRHFPRKAQDEEFLATARRRLLESFVGDPASDLKLLAVDLGTRGASCALFRGREFVRAEHLKVVKIDRLLARPPERAPDDATPEKGVSGDHVERHLEALAEGARTVAGHRAASTGPPAPAPAEDAPPPTAQLRHHDFRRLVLHSAWMKRDWVRLNARQIIAIAEREGVDLIAFESLRGFFPKGYDKLDLDQKRRLAFFAYGRIRRKVAEKAVERGMRIVTLPYGFSSQMCSLCGWMPNDGQKEQWTKEKKVRRFVCGRSGCAHAAGKPNDPQSRSNAGLDSDENAARVLARVFWGDLTLPPLEKREAT